MKIDELTPEEKLLVLNSRLDKLQASASRSGTVLNIFQMKNGEINLSIAETEKEKAISIALDDESADVIFTFLKERYRYKKEIEYLNTPINEPRPKKTGGWKSGVNT